MSIKKQFLKSKPECKVTFKFEKQNGLTPGTVKLIGDFNGWDTTVEPMKPLKSGDFTQTVKLTSGTQVQFRYLVNDTEWINEEEADGYIDNGMGTFEKNSILNL